MASLQHHIQFARTREPYSTIRGYLSRPDTRVRDVIRDAARITRNIDSLKELGRERKFAAKTGARESGIEPDPVSELEHLSRDVQSFRETGLFFHTSTGRTAFGPLLGTHLIEGQQFDVAALATGGGVSVVHFEPIVIDSRVLFPRTIVVDAVDCLDQALWLVSMFRFFEAPPIAGLFFTKKEAQSITKPEIQGKIRAAIALDAFGYQKITGHIPEYGPSLATTLHYYASSVLGVAEEGIVAHVMNVMRLYANSGLRRALFSAHLLGGPNMSARSQEQLDILEAYGFLFDLAYGSPRFGMAHLLHSTTAEVPPNSLKIFFKRLFPLVTSVLGKPLFKDDPYGFAKMGEDELRAGCRKVFESLANQNNLPIPHFLGMNMAIGETQLFNPASMPAIVQVWDSLQTRA